MIAMRKMPVTIFTHDLTVGDEILIQTRSYGQNILTVVRDDDRGLLLMFEECVDDVAMNSDNTNAGGFEHSAINRWLQEGLRPELPDFITQRLIELSIPTYGMIFGHDDFYEHFEPDDDEQLPCMKLCKNRIATLDDDTCWYWLRNATKKEFSSTAFAYVSGGGHAGCRGAGIAGGVRPIVLIRK